MAACFRSATWDSLSPLICKAVLRFLLRVFSSCSQNSRIFLRPVAAKLSSAMRPAGHIVITPQRLGRAIACSHAKGVDKYQMVSYLSLSSLSR